LFSGIVFITLLLTKIGVAFRFLSLYAPFAILLITFLLFAIKQRLNVNKLFFSFGILAFVFWEIWFSIGSIFFEFPRLGVVELDQYFRQEIGSARSSVFIRSPNPHLNAIIQDYYNERSKGVDPVLIVYDDNIIMSPRLWLFTRRLYYEGVPAMTVGQFNSIIAQSGPEYFKSYKIYFVKANENSVVVNNNGFFNPDAKNLENFLKKEFNLTPIKTTYGLHPTGAGLQKVPTFYVYKILF
jgi:hypothetical protein